MLAWEQAQFAAAVADMFGFHAVQLGLPELDTLEANRMPHRWLGLPETELPWVESTGPGQAEPWPALQRWAFVTHAAALPFPAASLDLLVLPHTLELSARRVPTCAPDWVCRSWGPRACTCRRRASSSAIGACATGSAC
jgi:hypothetical protein